jgi:hypothetical protein
VPNGIRQPNLTPPVFVPMHNIGWTQPEEVDKALLDFLSR